MRIPVILLAWLEPLVYGFAPCQQRHVSLKAGNFHFGTPSISSRLSAEPSEEEEKEENPYQDPNYPDLEFVNYADPEYQVDQGIGDEFFDPSSTEAQVEAMREERRMRNDEFQFETYYKDVLKNGEEYKGEWTVFQTSTFLEENDGPAGFPKLKKLAEPFKVYSNGERIEIEGSTTSDYRLQNQRLLHNQRLFVSDEVEKNDSPEVKEIKESIVNTKYCPEEMMSLDFRGQQGNMCVGNGYTVSTAVDLKSGKATTKEGPYSEYRAELGIQMDELRFRVKLDYSVRDVEKKKMKLPPLHLRTMTICRETLGMWPRAENYKSAIEGLTDVVFFGPAGAVGGLYDPPPVGSEEQASQYMMLDLEGGATLLLPYLMDQDPEAHPDSLGWVTALDWTPGKLRFQVDRKTNGGKDVLGLRTLELSEVQSADAATYRPQDGGSDMRQ